MSMHMGSFSSDDYHQKMMMMMMMTMSNPTTRRSSSSSNKLQGPRPAALKVSKSSSKITKKPGIGLEDHHRRRSRSPVVIYLVSPKIIHVRPEEFMGLVQRLTGKETTSLEAANSSSSSSELFKNKKCPISNSTDPEAAVNYPDQQQDPLCVFSPPSKLAAYSSLCKDICANWDDFSLIN